MFLNSFLSGFFIPLYCYAHFAEKVHPLRNALIRYGVTFDNNMKVAKMQTDAQVAVAKCGMTATLS